MPPDSQSIGIEGSFGLSADPFAELTGEARFPVGFEIRDQRAAGGHGVEEEVFPNREPRNDRLRDAIGTDQVDAEIHRLARRGRRDRAAVEQDAPAGGRRKAEQRAADAFLPGAAQADETDHLAGSDAAVERTGVGRW